MEESAVREMFAIEDRHWWFQAKRRVVNRLLEPLIPSLPPGPIVDLGCGTGRTLEDLRAHGRAMGLDEAASALAFCRQRQLDTLVRADAAQLPLRTGSIAVLTALDLLEHLEDDLSCAREIHRALAPGGVLLASAPAYRFLWSPHDDVLHHRRRYTRRAFAALLRSAGFQIERHLAFNFLLLPPIAAVRILRRWLPLGRSSTDFFLLPAPLNAVLRGIFEIEWAIDRWISFPIGVTWMTIARKGS